MPDDRPEFKQHYNKIFIIINLILIINIPRTLTEDLRLSQGISRKA